jgi:hypothetical protein
MSVEQRAKGLAEIERVLRIFHPEPGAIVEISAKAIGSRTSKEHWYIGYFDDFVTAANAALELDLRDEVEGVYFTPNRLNPRVLERSKNKIDYAPKHRANARDITRRTWLLFDIDADLSPGIRVNESDLEKIASVQRVIRAHLKAAGFPDPVVAYSGGGQWLFYRIDEPNDPATDSLIQSIIRNVTAAVVREQPDAARMIDSKVTNADRLTRLFGTHNCKNRARVLTKILDEPSSLETVSTALLKAIGGPWPSRNGAARSEKRDWEAYLAEHGVTIVNRKRDDAGTRLFPEHCPFDANHTGTSCYFLVFDSGAIAFKCSHSSCAGKGWPEARELLEPDFKDQQRGESEKRGASQKLLELALNDGMTFVHDVAGTPFVIVRRLNGQTAIQPVQSVTFRQLLCKRYYEEYRAPVSGNAVSDARAVMEGLAVYEGPEVEIYLRYYNADGLIEIDLGDEQWRKVCITPKGWSTEPHGERRFRRPRGMLALPEPMPGGSIDELRRFVHVDDENFVRLLMFAVCAMRGCGPYPILPIGGEQGSAKSTAARVLKKLIDPSKPLVRPDCKDERELAIIANNNHFIAFDNLSELSPRMADAICRLSTGGGFSTRQLYSDFDEILFEAQRPIVMTSIIDLLNRADVAERSLPAQCLPFVDEDERIDEELFWAEFDAAKPRLFGALLDLLSIALARLPEVTAAKPRLGRMADACKWTMAAEPGLPIELGGIPAIWDETYRETVTAALESSPIATPLISILNGRLETECFFECTMSELLKDVNGVAPEEAKKSRLWPQSPQSLSNRLKRLSPALRAAGFTFGEALPRQNDRRVYAFNRLKT